MTTDGEANPTTEGNVTTTNGGAQTATNEEEATATNGNGVATPRKRVADSPKVWTSLLTNTAYLSGLLTLDYSLKKHSSSYPLLVLYTDTLSDEGHAALERRGIPKQRIEYLLPKAHKDYTNDLRFYDCWSKLQPFGLFEYERVVQMDSDMLVLKNMDELMELEFGTNEEGKDVVFAASHACVCNPFGYKHYPQDWVRENCAYTTQEMPPFPEIAQTIGAPPLTGHGICNGGLQVVNPSPEIYNMILSSLSTPSKTENYEFSDQSLLSDIFRGRWLPLSYKYNALKTLRWCHQRIWRDDEVKNVHYILSPKPWDESEEEKKQGFGDAGMGRDFCNGWWWEYNDERKAKEKEMGVEDEW